MSALRAQNAVTTMIVDGKNRSVVQNNDMIVVRDDDHTSTTMTMETIITTTTNNNNSSINRNGNHGNNLPIEVLVQNVAPFLDRETFNNVASASKVIHHLLTTSQRQQLRLRLLSSSSTTSGSSCTTGIVIPPWPNKLKSRDHKTRIRCIVFSDDGTNLACGCSDGMIRTWNVWTGERRRQLQDRPGEAVVVLAFSPDGTKLASASTGHTIKIWSLLSWAGEEKLSTTSSSSSSRTMPRPRNIHARDVSCLAFSRDGKKLYSGHHNDGEILRVFDVQTGRCQQTISGGTNNPVTTIRPCEDDQNLIAICTTTSLKVWDLSTGQCQNKWENGKAYNAIHVFETNDTKCNEPFSIQIASIQSEESFSVWTTSLSPNPKKPPLASRAGHNRRCARIGPPSTLPVTYFHNLCPYEIRFSSNGQKVASIDDFTSVKVWNANSSTGSEEDSASTNMASFFQDESLFPIHDIAFAVDQTVAVVSRYYNAIHLFRA